MLRSLSQQLHGARCRQTCCAVSCAVCRLPCINYTCLCTGGAQEMRQGPATDPHARQVDGIRVPPANETGCVLWLKVLEAMTRELLGRQPDRDACCSGPRLRHRRRGTLCGLMGPRCDVLCLQAVRQQSCRLNRKQLVKTVDIRGNWYDNSIQRQALHCHVSSPGAAI
jgi:hypothetical protein